MRFFATAAKGTEPALRDELRELRFHRVRADRGGVHFEGDLVDAARACLWSRVAVRVLLEVGRFEAPDAAALYAGARDVDWRAWMNPRTTLAVRATCRSSRLTHSQYVALKVKDAIVDVIRDQCGARPSVDTSDPDALVAVHLANDRAALYLDVSGGSLHERGWRARAGEAPVRETLAAAVVRLSGWDRQRILVDPMCGAGTIAIEAASWWLGIAPGRGRPRLGLERWASHDETTARRLRLLREEARAVARPSSERAPVVARDIDPRAVELTTHNARLAGVEMVVERRDIRDLVPFNPPAHVVTNPPFGARLEADPTLFQELSRVCRRLKGHSVAILAGTPAIAKAMRRKPDRWWILYNGAVECRFLVYDIR